MKTKALLKHYDWLNIAYSYLLFSKIGLLEWRQQIYLKSEIKKVDSFAELRYGNDIFVPWLLVPIIWNFKHAMELILKSLSIAIDEEFKPVHDRNELFSTLRTKLASQKILSMRLEEQICSLETLVGRYDQKVFPLDISSVDSMNELGRFPESRGRTDEKIDWIEKLINMQTKDVEILEEDIENLNKISGLIYTQIPRRQVSYFKEKSS